MRTVFAIAGLLAAAGITGSTPAQLRVNKRADLSQPVALEPGQGAIIVGFRRPDPMSTGKSGAATFARYDLAKRDLIFQPRDAKKSGDTTTYWIQVSSGDKTLSADYAVMPVSAGDYVLFGATPGPAKQVLNTFCLGAPSFHVNAGEVVYFGDLSPYMLVKLEDGTRTSAMAYSSHPDDARKAIAAQPALAPAFRAGELHNQSTYACVGQLMTAYIVPGAPALEPAPPPAAEAATVAQ